MHKRLFPALFAAGLLVPAQAQDFWSFSYTGFLLEKENRFDPAFRLDGAFDGEDTDGDGLLELEELTGFWYEGQDFFARPGGGCYLSRCELKQFTYELALGRLFFDAEYGYSDEASISSHTTVTGLSHYQYSETGYRPPFYTSTQTWLWTDQTRFAISPPPVSEPAFGMLLPGGLLLLAATRAGRRWRRGRDPGTTTSTGSGSVQG
ncbi:hypothetical protein [Massilia consociata]|uniref:PEP-CTERM sorting domain-containing protein n=1 Tax=Massilia consociata TaxID=760117 RepID=A0ABV6FB40_9BURK